MGYTPQQKYQFDGWLNDPDEPKQHRSFTVAAGDGAATPTGGFAQVQIVNRPRNKAFTVVAGFDPFTLDIPVRFDQRIYPGAIRELRALNLEQQVQTLEWMAGRGKLYTGGTRPARGNPPVVQITSFSSAGVASNLIPVNFHSDGSRDLRWLMSGLEYAEPIRDAFGNRVLQDVTVSVTEYVAAAGEPSAPKDRQKDRGTVTHYRTVRSTQAQNTIAKICRARGYRRESEWTTVLQFNLQNGGCRTRSWHTPLKVGTVVQIPDSLGASVSRSG